MKQLTLQRSEATLLSQMEVLVATQVNHIELYKIVPLRQYFDSSVPDVILQVWATIVAIEVSVCGFSVV